MPGPGGGFGANRKLLGYCGQLRQREYLPRRADDPGPMQRNPDADLQGNGERNSGNAKRAHPRRAEPRFHLASVSTCTGAVTEGKKCTVNVSFAPASLENAMEES